jgi:hypothetical protein
VRRLTIGIALVFVAVLALACGPRVAHAQLLTLAYAKGDHFTYKLHMTSDNTFTGFMPGSFKFDVTATETVNVQSVDSAGVADLKVSLTKVTMKFTMSSSQSTSTTTTTTTYPDIEMKIGPDGHLVSVGGQTMGGTFMSGLSGGPSLISAVLPSTSVKPGDTWSKDYDEPVPSGGGTIHITTKSKYVRDESVKGVNAAVVNTTSTETLNLTLDSSAFGPVGTGGQMSPGAPTSPNAPQSISVKVTITSDTTSWIDPAGHRMLKTHGTSKYDGSVTINMLQDPSAHAFVTSLGIKGSQQLTLDPA